MRDEWTDKTILWEVVANFDAGNSTEEVDAYPGMAGDGWATWWDVTEQGAGHCTVTAQNTSQVDDGYYLSVSVNNPEGSTYATVSRSYAIEDDTDKKINLKVYHRIQFSLRIDETTISHLDSAGDKYVISLSDTATTDMGPQDVFCIFVTGDAAEYGEQAVRKWALINGDREGGVNSVIGSGISLISGETYFFEIDVNAEDRTYQVRITSGAASFESEILDWRTDADNAGGHLNFICRCDSANDTRVFSLDSIKITQEPGCLVKPALFDSECLCAEVCAPCEFVPPNINTDKCVHPYIKLTRHDNLATDDPDLPPWAYYHMTDFCMAGHETRLTCCGCFSWEYELVDDFNNHIEDYVVITYPWIACEYPVEIVGTENCSFHRTIAYQAVYLSFHYVKGEYLIWKNAKENGSFDGMTREEELAACNIKCFQQIHFGAEYSERNFRFQGQSVIDLSAYFWLPPLPYASYDAEGKLILETEDAGSVSEAIDEATSESVPGMSGSSPAPGLGQPGWTIDVLVFEEDLEGIDSDGYAAEMKQNIDYTAGGIGEDYMVGTDCQLYMPVPPCHWLSKGIQITIQSIADVTYTWPDISGTTFNSSGDPLELPRTYWSWTQAAERFEYHSGDPSVCDFPCRYANLAKAAIVGYQTNGGTFSFHREASLLLGSAQGKTFYCLLGHDTPYWTIPIDGHESYSWSCPGYTVTEWNQVLCGTGSRTTDVTVQSANVSSSHAHPSVGALYFSLDVYLDPVTKRVMLRRITLDGNVHDAIGPASNPLHWMHASYTSGVDPIVIESGDEIEVPCEIWQYDPVTTATSWVSTNPIIIKFGL